MHNIAIFYFAIFCFAILETLSADFDNDATLNLFVTSDDYSAGDSEILGDFPADSSGDFSADFPAGSSVASSLLQPEASNLFYDPSFDQFIDGVDPLAIAYTPNDCFASNDQQVGKRIRARRGLAVCYTDPKTSSDEQTSDDTKTNANEDLIFKNNDGLQTEPKNWLGLNRHGTNSDGTICPPPMWLLCSATEPDLQTFCLGCYPCKYSGFACHFKLVSERLRGQRCV